MLYTVTPLRHAKNGQTVTYVLGETWEVDGADPDTCPENYDISYAREFRYDSGRARYLNRQLDVSAATGLMHNPPLFTPVSEIWTDYDDDTAYRDFTINGSQGTDLDAFQPGIAEFGSGTTKYEHGDLIGTRRSQSVFGGSPAGGVTYTAFGERIDGANHRYGYVGSWGYQTHEELPFLHVGARYYDSATGRFLERDPMGIEDGVNVYTYADNNPLYYIDPSGLSKGGKQNIIPSDRPNNWDKMTDKQQQDYMKDKIENPNSPEHKKVWKAYRKDWGRNKVKESSRPPWYARIGRHIPVPDQQTANRWGRNAALVGAGAACAAIIVSTGGAAAPLLVPAL